MVSIAQMCSRRSMARDFSDRLRLDDYHPHSIGALPPGPEGSSLQRRNRTRRSQGQAERRQRKAGNIARRAEAMGRDGFPSLGTSGGNRIAACRVLCGLEARPARRIRPCCMRVGLSESTSIRCAIFALGRHSGHLQVCRHL